MDNKVKYLNEFKGGSMARTFLISKNGKQWVRKVAGATADNLGLQKLKAQWDWILDFNKKYPDILPSVRPFVVEKLVGHYDMEFIEMGNFRDYLITKPGYDSTLINDLLNYGATIAAKDMQHKESKNMYIRDKHLKKMVERCALLHDSDIYKSEYLIINGKKLKNLGLLIEEISSDSNIMEFLKPKTWYRSHGDLTFQNILTNEEEIRIIDPRGEGADSIYYDISKLYQSCHGKYDLLYDGNYACQAFNNSVDGETYIDYTIKNGVEKFNNIFKLIRDLIPDYYDIQDDHWEIATKFFEGSHFISMVPFRLRENPTIAITCYAIGIGILNEMLEDYKQC